MKAWTPTRSASLVSRGSNPARPAWLTVDCRRSIPAQKESPVPVISSARTAGRPGPHGRAATMSSRISTVSAFLASGRSRIDAADVVVTDVVADHRRMLTGARLH